MEFSTIGSVPCPVDGCSHLFEVPVLTMPATHGRGSEVEIYVDHAALRTLGEQHVLTDHPEVVDD